MGLKGFSVLACSPSGISLIPTRASQPVQDALRAWRRRPPTTKPVSSLMRSTGSLQAAAASSRSKQAHARHTRSRKDLSSNTCAGAEVGSPSCRPVQGRACAVVKPIRG